MGKDFQVVDVAADFGKLMGDLPAALDDGNLSAQRRGDKVLASFARAASRSIRESSLSETRRSMRLDFCAMRSRSCLKKVKPPAGGRKRVREFTPGKAFGWARRSRVHTKGNLDVIVDNERDSAPPTTSRRGQARSQ